MFQTGIRSHTVNGAIRYSLVLCNTKTGASVIYRIPAAQARAMIRGGIAHTVGGTYES